MVPSKIICIPGDGSVSNVVSTSSIRVDHILCSNGLAQVTRFTFSDNDDNVYFTITAMHLTSESVKGSWLAENGLKITHSGAAGVKIVYTVVCSADGV